MRRGEFWPEPREKPDEIVEDENVSVTILAAANPDCRARDGFCDFSRERGMDEFQHEGLRSCFVEGLGVGNQAVGLGVAFAFDAVAAFLDDSLGKHSEVADDGDSVGDNGLEHPEDFAAALDFHKVRTGLAEEAGVFHREFRRGATPCGKIGSDECFFRPTGYGTRVVNHVGHGHLGGVGLAEDDHAERIADEQKIEPTAIEQTRGRVVVGGQPGEAPASGFGCAKRCGCGFHGAAEY